MPEESQISAEYLFHFTQKRENLESILLNHFMPFYCMEKLTYLNIIDSKTNDYHEMAFPLVCFCDIPTPLQGMHRSKFGQYGIGLEKSWGIRNRLTPVVYSHKYSMLSLNLKYLIELYKKLEDRVSKEELQGLNNHISYLLMNYKAYEGFSYIKDRQEFDTKITRFYDEREWRFLPIECNGLKLNLERDEFVSKETLEIENLKIQRDNKLTFQISDVKYLYLRDKSEIEPFLNVLKRKYTDSEINMIKEKIHIN